MWNKIKRSFFVPVIALFLGVCGYYIWNAQGINGSIEQEHVTRIVDLDDYFVQEITESERMQPVLEQKAIVSTEHEKSKTGFLLCVEDGHVVVYEQETNTRYLTTGITMDALPEETRQEIEQGKTIENEMELYSFLETHSS